MSWSAYAGFLAFAIVLVLVPGPDFAVVTRHTLAAGRQRGMWSAAGIATSNAVQGLAAAAGLGVLIVRIEPESCTRVASVGTVVVPPLETSCSTPCPATAMLFAMVFGGIHTMLACASPALSTRPPTSADIVAPMGNRSAAIEVSVEAPL